MDKTAGRGRGLSRENHEHNQSPSTSISSTSSVSLSDYVPSWLVPILSYLSVHFAWVRPNLTWSKLKPAIRCSLIAWTSLVLFVIPKVQAVMGQSSFLILIAITLSFPADPFLSVLEREFLILLFACISWAWCCLGLFLANLARRVHDPTATIFDVSDGRYIEAAPSIIIGIFIFFGSATLVGFKAKQGPGPYFVPCILSCLVINISLTTGALFPYPYYLVGKSILIPICLHSGVSLVGSVVIFPSTISALFTTRLQDTLNPGLATLASHISLLSTPLTSPSFPIDLATLRANTKKCETTLVPLAAARRLLHNDIIYGRFAPGDFIAFHGMLRRFAGRADGLSVFFGLIDPARERFPGTSTHTAATTPVETSRVGLSRATSRAPSLETIRTRENLGQGPSSGITLSPIQQSSHSISRSHLQPSSTTSVHSRSHSHLSTSPNSPLDSTNPPPNSPLSPTHSRTQSQSQQHSQHHHHHALLHSSLLSLARAHARKPEYAVGTFESQRYLNLEATTLWDPMEEEWNVQIGELLKDSCVSLLEACSVGITTVNDWLSTVRDARLVELFSPSTSSSFLGIQEKKIPHPFTSENPSSVTQAPPPVSSTNTSSNANMHDTSTNNNSNSGAAILFSWFGLSPNLRARELHRKREERLKKVKKIRNEVAKVLEEFRRVGRHSVLEPYKHAFDHDYDDYHMHHDHSGERPMRDYFPIYDDGKETKTRSDTADGVCEEDEHRGPKEKHPQTPANRYLFNCFVFQYNLLQISSIILEMLDEIIRLEELRTHCRLWTPAERALIWSFRWSSWLVADNVEHFGDDDDPDVIQGLTEGFDDSTLKRTPPTQNAGITSLTNTPNTNPLLRMPSQRTGPAFDLSTSTSTLPHDPLARANDLGLPKRRDPDALPPSNVPEWLMAHTYRFFAGLGSDGVLFSIKAGLLTVALSLPSLIKGSAGFAYDNRFFWGIFMGQLTIARFRGDTIFIISARIFSTFYGAIVGLVMWYISCGSGNGNPYGLAAVCAVCFPFIFFSRIYWPIPTMRNIVFFVTIVLVIGYSYQDTHLNIPGTPGVGWSVAWKRFTLVVAGVVAAFIASFFPPATTIRLYQRRLLATTSSELGTIYCSILSFANTKHEPEIQEIIASLIAVRAKLSKSAVMVNNVAYEFSFRGKWPAERYRKIAELQVGISYALSHLMSVLEHIEPSWARAFLRRTRFMDPGFQGDVLAVISMISSSLRTGNPLPQITPCPLIDRFMLKYHGLNVIHKDAEEDYGLPRTLSMDTLKDEQYLMFSVGISTAFGIINRLDRLMLAMKEIVGEQYHIHGVGFARARAPSEYFPYGRPAAATSSINTSGGGREAESGPRTTVHFEPPV